MIVSAVILTVVSLLVGSWLFDRRRRHRLENLAGEGRLTAGDADVLARRTGQNPEIAASTIRTELRGQR